MLGPPIVTDMTLATLVFHHMLCKSPDKSVYCPPGLADNESLDGGINYGSLQNDTPGELMYLIKCRGRGHNYSVSAIAARFTYSECFFN